VCVGLAPSKTLAKVAGHYAKKLKIKGGVLELSTDARIEKALRHLPVEKIWGVGGRTQKKLNDMGIYSAWQLANADMKSMRKRFSVVMERTILELRGISCVEFDAEPDKKQQIICTRSFGEKIQQLKPLQEALAYHVTRACVTLRQQQSLARSINVGLGVSQNNGKFQQHTHSITVQLPQASDFTADFLQAANRGLQQLFRTGCRYKKAGIMLNDITDAKNTQLDLFNQTPQQQHDLMNTLDNINAKFGKGTLRSAQEGFSHQWAMRANIKSPEYTTNWNQLISVK
jgi:DNA polymerase V